MRSITYIVKESISSFREDGCLNLSAAIAFYAILSLIPFLYLLVSLVGFFVGSEGQVLPKVSSYISQLIPFISKPVLSEVGRINVGSGIFAWLAVFFMLWSSTLIFDSIEFSLKKVFKAEHLRPFWISKIMSLLFVPVAGVVFILLQVFNLAIDAFVRVNNYFGIILIPLFLNSIGLKYIFPFTLTFLLLSALYAIVTPGMISLRQAMIGGFICAIMLEVAKHVFGWMIRHNPNFGLVYGSLNTLILMILWIFYASAIFLFCAEIISAYQKQKASA
jgi:YihY family inner membrane protein